MESTSSSASNKIVQRKKTFWRMIKTMFIPAQTIAKLVVGCGSSKRKGKGKRRLTLSQMKDARDAFIRSSTVSATSQTRDLGAPLSRPTALNSVPVMQCPRHPQGSEILTHHDDHVLSPEFANSTVPIPFVDSSSSGIIREVVDTDDDDSDSCILTLGTTPPEMTRLGPHQNGNVRNESERLPAPLTLEEAQVYLDSLTLQDHNNSIGTSTSPSPAEQMVTTTVEIENVRLQTQVGETNEVSRSPNLRMNPSSSEHFEEWDSEDGSDLESNDEEERELGNGTTQRNRIQLLASMPHILDENENERGEDSNREVGNGMRRSRTSASLPRSSNTHRQGGSRDDDEFHGWRRSSIEVSSNPPVTLAFIPSGLCIGDRVVWVKDDHPEIGTVRWIGKIRNQFYAGIEFDKPCGNSSGIYGYGVGLYKRLFTCQLSYGRFVPVKELVLYKDYHATGVRSGIVCVICRDDFLDSWEPELEQFLQDAQMEKEDEGTVSLQPFHMVSTKCGHLYHWGCLDQWFSTKKRNEFHCPFCLRPMERTEVIRIFPSQT